MKYCMFNDVKMLNRLLGVGGEFMESFPVQEDTW